jgi:hypothetical protein
MANSQFAQRYEQDIRNARELLTRVATLSREELKEAARQLREISARYVHHTAEPRAVREVKRAVLVELRRTTTTPPPPSPVSLEEKINDRGGGETAPHRDLLLHNRRRARTSILEHGDSFTENDDILGTLLRWYKKKGIVGEENNCILQTLALSSGIHFGVEGYSGSGKTFLVDAAMGLLPEGMVYTLELMSETAVMYDAERINTCSVLYIPELQKAYTGGKKTPLIAEVIKSLTEGKSITRTVTGKGKAVHRATIYPGCTVVYTLAHENALKKDDETARRFIVLETDASIEQREKIREAKAEGRFFREQYQTSPEDEIKLKKHLYAIMQTKESKEVRDPYAMAMQRYLPATLRGACFTEHYFDLVEASAAFHYPQREERDGSLFTSLEDHALIQDLYFPRLFDQLTEMDVSKDDQQILEEAKKRWDTEGIQWNHLLSDAVAKMRTLPGNMDAWLQREERAYDEVNK